MIQRKATSIWNSSLKDGKGTLSTGSGVLSGIPYSAKMRFENQPGTNPEELIGAAHAGCFAMALAGELDRRGFTAQAIRADSVVSLDRPNGKWTIIEAHLDVVAVVPEVSQDDFDQIAQAAKEGCPVSRALKVKTTVTTRLSREKIDTGERKAG